MLKVLPFPLFFLLLLSLLLLLSELSLTLHLLLKLSYPCHFLFTASALTLLQKVLKFQCGKTACMVN